MNSKQEPVERVIGFDCHPDTFTAAMIRGTQPAAALVEKTFDKVPLAQLKKWALKYTTDKDLFLLEASGNSFHVVRTLASIQRRAKVLESCQLGRLKDAHANNDRLSAVRIGKAYLSGTAKEVWVPDPRTQERRDWFHAYRKAVKRTTQMRNRLLSYLSDNGVRFKDKTPLPRRPNLAGDQIGKANTWSPRQWQIIEGMLMELRHAEESRHHWHSLIAQEVLEDAHLLSLVRLCGVRDLIAFSVGAIIGDIKRFENPRKLVSFVGLNPRFDDSGNEKWTGGIGGRGRQDLRSLLIEAAQSILRCGNTPLAKWGKRLLARKGEIKLVVAAIARKLTVAIWYLLMGKATPVEEIDTKLQIKVGKILTAVGADGLEQLGKKRDEWREQIYQRLKTGREYALDPDKKFSPSVAAAVAGE